MTNRKERGGIMNGVERVRMRERMHQLADMANTHRVAAFHSAKG